MNYKTIHYICKIYKLKKMSVRVRKFSKQSLAVIEFLEDVLENKKSINESVSLSPIPYNDDETDENKIDNIYVTKKGQKVRIPKHITNLTRVKENRPHIKGEAQIFLAEEYPINTVKESIELIDGYPKTKDTQFVISDITKKFDLELGETVVCDYDKRHSDKIARFILLYLPISITEELLHTLDIAMYNYGYFRVAQPHEYNDGVVSMQYEPYQYGERLTLSKKLVHLTLTKNLDAIEKSGGLVPKHHSSVFEYPERIFFFKSTNFGAMLAVLVKNNKISYPELSENITWFSVFTDKLKNDNVGFYWDPMIQMGNLDAFYTYQSIPNKALSISGKINPEDFKYEIEKYL